MAYEVRWNNHEWIVDMPPDTTATFGDGMEDKAAARKVADALNALQAIAAGPQDEPQIELTGEYEKGLYCGLEDVGLQGDGYGACEHGFHAGVERALEWAQGIAKGAL